MPNTLKNTAFLRSDAECRLQIGRVRYPNFSVGEILVSRYGLSRVWNAAVWFSTHKKMCFRVLAWEAVQHYSEGLADTSPSSLQASLLRTWEKPVFFPLSGSGSGFSQVNGSVRIGQQWPLNLKICNKPVWKKSLSGASLFVATAFLILWNWERRGVIPKNG